MESREVILMSLFVGQKQDADIKNRLVDRWARGWDKLRKYH